MLTSSIVQFLGWIAAFVCAFLLGNVFRPFFNSYAAKKGENLATKEDIAQLTKIAEGIKAEISDKVWDRQTQWEMRRDAVSDAWRALRELETSLVELHSVYSLPISDDDATKNSRLSKQHDARAHFYSNFTKYLHAKEFADLLVGKELPKHLSAYLRLATPIASEIMNENAGYFTPERKKELADKSIEIRQEARKELNIKDADRVLV